jgi:hypothetical protein
VIELIGVGDMVEFAGRMLLQSWRLATVRGGA